MKLTRCTNAHGFVILKKNIHTFEDLGKELRLIVYSCEIQNFYGSGIGLDTHFSLSTQFCFESIQDQRLLLIFNKNKLIRVLLIFIIEK